MRSTLDSVRDLLHDEYVTTTEIPTAQTMIVRTSSAPYDKFHAATPSRIFGMFTLACSGRTTSNAFPVETATPTAGRSILCGSCASRGLIGFGR